MSRNTSNDDNCMTWTWRVKVPQAAIGVILAYLMGAGTVYAVTKNSQRQESSQSQNVEQIVCPLQQQTQSAQTQQSSVMQSPIPGARGH